MQADKKQVVRLLKTAQGQIDGILRMIEEDRYCLDICHQIMSTQAILKRTNKEIIGSHMKNCVLEAVEGDDAQKKIDEMIGVIDQLLK